MFKKRIVPFLNDSIWSIVGLVLMNVAAQFVVYPAWNRKMGTNQYGEILFLISVMNVVATSIGSACNYTRMTKQGRSAESNVDYNCILVVASVLLVPFGILVATFSMKTMTFLETFLYVCLCIITMWRFYADVEFRLNLNYRGYFAYYAIIGIGYLVGVFLYNATDLWTLALIPGEVLGILFVCWKGTVFRGSSFKMPTSQFKQIVKMAITLSGTGILSSLVFNGDRVLLRTLMGGTAVTIYYLASLLGKTMSLITTPLNSVIIGYLARYEGDLKIKFVSIMAGLLTVVAVIATAVCTVGSYILIPLLYPEEFAYVTNYFVIANLAQILYFLGNVVTVMLLRFSKERYQIYINVTYAIAFLGLCPALTIWKQMDGFCIGLLLTCFIRFALGIALGYREAFIHRQAA